MRRSIHCSLLLLFIALSLAAQRRVERFIPTNAAFTISAVPSRMLEKAGAGIFTNNIVRSAFTIMDRLTITPLITNGNAYGIDTAANMYITVMQSTNMGKASSIRFLLRIADPLKAVQSFGALAAQNDMRILPRQGYRIIAGTGKEVSAGFTDDAFLLIYSERSPEVELAFMLDAVFASSSEQSSLIADERFRSFADRRPDIGMYARLSFLSQFIQKQKKPLPFIGQPDRFASAEITFSAGRAKCSFDLYRLPVDEDIRRFARKLDPRIARYAEDKQLLLATGAYESAVMPNVLRMFTNNVLKGVAERFEHGLDMTLIEASKALRGDCLLSISKLDLDKRRYEFFSAFSCDTPRMAKLLSLFADKGVLERMTTNNTPYYMLVSDEPGFELVFFMVRNDILFISSSARKHILFGAEPKETPQALIRDMTENSLHIALDVDGLLAAFENGGTVDAALGAQAARGKLQSLSISATMTDTKTASAVIKAGFADTNAYALTQVIGWLDGLFAESQPSRSKRREGQ